MITFAPFLPDSLEGIYKYFLSLFVNQGLQAYGLTQAGIKGIKGGKHLSHLYSLYSGHVYGWVCTPSPPYCGSFPLVLNTARNDPGFSLVLYSRKG